MLIWEKRCPFMRVHIKTCNRWKLDDDRGRERGRGGGGRGEKERGVDNKQLHVRTADN